SSCASAGWRPRRRPVRRVRLRSATPSVCANCLTRPGSPTCVSRRSTCIACTATSTSSGRRRSTSRACSTTRCSSARRPRSSRSAPRSRSAWRSSRLATEASTSPRARSSRRRAPDGTSRGDREPRVAPDDRVVPAGPPARDPLACAPMIYDDDADLSLLDGKTVAIIGYGSQGHAHALNLKDSGVDVVVGLRESSDSVAKAREQGLEVLSVVDAASRGDIVMILLPDERHHDVWEQEIRDGIAEGNMIMFGHGFSIHYDEVKPPPGVDVGMVAPKGPGHLVRRQFTEGSGVPGLIA